MTGFLLRVWCLDCCDIDPDGCFGGGCELRGKGGSDVPFETREEAEEAGWRFVGDAPYKFEVVERKSEAGPR